MLCLSDGWMGEFELGPYRVMRRPFVGEFLERVAEWYELAVWTSSTGAYAWPVVREVFREVGKLKFVWSRERCTQAMHPELREYEWVKDLRKVNRLGYRLERVVVVDDSPGKLKRHYGNLVRVSSFMGDAGDTELREVLPFLKYLSGVKNVRGVEKRDWRERERRFGGNDETRNQNDESMAE